VPERYLGQTLGKYRIESLLGSGGFAWVFKGYDPELDIPVAIKVLKPQFAGDQAVVDRFKREASTAARLRHPNIIKIYAVGRENDAVYFVMDYLPSGLATRLEATQSLPEEYVLRVGMDVARALGFAHREGVIHRDIKVDNILFDTHGNAVVADFGIARALSGYTNQTGTNMVVGTPQYFAPEQARAKPLDGRADLYSLGVTLFRAATGRLPFEGEDWYEIARQHVEEPPPSPREVNPALSPQFEALVLQCMAKTPDERPATGEQIAETIDQILLLRKDPSTAHTLTVSPAAGATPVSARKRKVQEQTMARKRLVGGAVVGAVVLAGLAALFALPLGGPRGLSSATPDSLLIDSTSGVPETTMVFPPAVVTDSGRPKNTTSPGRATTPPGKNASSTMGTIVVNAPQDARITINDQQIGIGQARKDSLAPGTYTVRAEMPAVDGCGEARQVTTVRVTAGGTHTVPLSPKLCGYLDIDYVARRNNQVITGSPVWFSLSPIQGPGAREATWTGGPRVVAVGRYRLTVRMAECSDYNEEIEILAGETTRVVIRPIC
jgi:serine/threonine-protein kinase